ncbi:hypothetical protein KFE25_000765 [Diacronema lutheri]|uniref:Saccharopine dehydrogenase NADP binding domain-containing protein n=1 Tax=Diacronema lutheri TaxID=2081491 RepID=A0A8J5XVS5_DIALT|nr:hypothetical protein KFE25_000765 [Diacronema lutheri]
MTRVHDVVILGATGFTGKLAAQYMARAYPPSSATPVRWAIAGRSADKLRDVLGTLGTAVDIVVCDLSDNDALERLVKSTSVVACYAGTPFIDKALPVVELCARHGTHYVDITGELPMHRASYDRYHDACKASGALVLHGCGFDSVPSDIGAFLAAGAMRERHDCGCSLIKMYYGKSSGGFSGGTLATIIALINADASMPGGKEVKQRGAYALDPVDGHGGPDTGSFGSPIVGYDRVGKTWVAPFVMAPTNAPVVRKSNAQLDYAYGRNMRYAEVMALPSLFAAVAVAVGLAAVGFAIVVPPIRALLFYARLLPRPGEGPSKQQQDEGFFASTAVAVGERGKEQLVTKAHVNSGNAGDPGYKATALMSMECALCLALQRDKCRAEGGVVTTAVGLGSVLVDRLNAAGMDVGVDK